MTLTDLYGDNTSRLPGDARVVNCCWCDRVLLVERGEVTAPGETWCGACQGDPGLSPLFFGGRHVGRQEGEASPAQENAIRRLEDGPPG